MTTNRFSVFAQRAMVLAITGLFWLVWLYLLAPLASLLLWLVGIHFFVTEMFDRGGYQALMHELVNYSVSTLAILGAVVAWVVWNKWRYGNHNTRKTQPRYVSISELSAFSGVSASAMRKLQSSKQATVDFDGKRRLLLRGSRSKVVAVMGSKDQEVAKENRL